MQYYGGDPRIKFLTWNEEADGKINPYEHYVKSKKGEELDAFVDISKMKKTEVIQLLADKNVVRTSPAQQDAHAEL